MASSSKDSGYVDNWQAGKTVTECNLHMLTTEDCSDVIFRVGSEKNVVRAHRYVLVSRSCVFHAMFCGPLAEKGEVTIPDVEPDIFREFLGYVYADTIDITAGNVTGLLYTSRKYAVDALNAKCAAFLENSLSEENVCKILEQCHGYGELDLEQKALKLLTEAGEMVIHSQGFIELCSDCLNKFLKSDDLKLTEEAIFEATLSWVNQQCLKEMLTLNHENIHKCLGDMKYEIRFKSMSLDFIASVVGPSEVLSDSERIRIMDSILKPNMDISPFNATQRKIQRPFKYVRRFESVSHDWICSSNTHAISFTVSKEIHLVGCELYGPDRGQEDDYSIGIQVRVNRDQVISEPFQDKQIRLLGEGKLNKIMFPDAVPLDPDSSYALSVTLIGPETASGEDGCLSKSVDGVNVFFKSSRKKIGCSQTTSVDGQIPGLIFRDPL